MNCVILSGRLAGRPRQACTGEGVPIAEFRLLVNNNTAGRPQPGAQEPEEHIDCVAERSAAEELVIWGERGHRVSLEGRLRAGSYWDLDGCRRTGARVHAHRVEFVDPVKELVGTPPLVIPVRTGIDSPTAGETTAPCNGTGEAR